MTTSSVPEPRAAPSRRVAIAVAIAVVVAIFPDVVFGGASLRKSLLIRIFENDLEVSAWIPESKDREIRDGLRDVGATAWQVEPAQRFMRHVFRSGESPYWNPYNACGTYGPERVASNQFSVVTLATALLGAGSTALHAVLLATFAFAVYCLFRLLTVFLRRSVLASVAACFVFLLCGFHTSMIGSQVTQSYLLSPVLLYALLNLVRSRTALAFLGAVFASALLLVETFMPATVLALIAVHSVALAGASTRWRDFRRDAPRQLLIQGAVAVLGLLLVAPLWFPVLEGIRLAEWDGASDRAYFDVRASAALSLVTPKHFWESYGAFDRTRGFDPRQLRLGHLETHGVYHLGIVAWLVALQAFAARRFRRHPVVAVCAALITATLGRLFGLFPFTLVEHLPFFSDIRTQYWGALAGLPFVLLLAYGFDALSRRTVGKWPTWVFLCFFVSGFFFLLGKLGEPAPDNPASMHLKIMFGILAATLALFALVRARSRWHMALSLCLLFLMIGELVFYTNRLRPQRKELDPFAVPFIELLRRDLGDGRVLNIGSRGLPANWGSALQIPQVGSLDGVSLRWYADFFQRFAKTSYLLAIRPAPRTQSADPTLDFDALDLAGVRYVLVSSKAMQGYARLLRKRGFPVRQQALGVTVFENPRVYPRAFAVRGLIEGPGIPGDRDLPGRAVAMTTDRALLDRARRIGVPTGAGTAAGPVASDAEVRIREYRHARVVLETALERPSVVVLADTWHPNWRVEVDGERAHLGRVNDAFRGVAVPAGRHRLVMTYAPRTLPIAILTSGLVLVILTTSTILSLRKPR